MPTAYTQNFYHAVFSTKHRQPLITADIEPRLYAFIGGIVRDLRCTLLAVNGMPDHVHILIGLKPAMALADLVREIKADSTNYINKEKFVRGRFNWQEGYGAFSYGHSQLNTIIRYIQNQERHHQKQSFKTEYMKFLRKFDIAFDEKYVFDFIE